LGAAEGAGLTAVQEGLLQSSQMTRTTGESFFNISAGAVLGGVIGGAIGLYYGGAGAKAAATENKSVTALARVNPSTSPPVIIHDVNRMPNSPFRETGVDTPYTVTFNWGETVGNLGDNATAVLRNYAHAFTQADESGRAFMRSVLSPDILNEVKRIVRDEFGTTPVVGSNGLSSAEKAFLEDFLPVYQKAREALDDILPERYRGYLNDLWNGKVQRYAAAEEDVAPDITVTEVAPVVEPDLRKMVDDTREAHRGLVDENLFNDEEWEKVVDELVDNEPSLRDLRDDLKDIGRTKPKEPEAPPQEKAQQEAQKFREWREKKTAQDKAILSRLDRLEDEIAQLKEEIEESYGLTRKELTRDLKRLQNEKKRLKRQLDGQISEERRRPLPKKRVEPTPEPEPEPVARDPLEEAQTFTERHGEVDFQAKIDDGLVVVGRQQARDRAIWQATLYSLDGRMREVFRDTDYNALLARIQERYGVNLDDAVVTERGQGAEVLEDVQPKPKPKRVVKRVVRKAEPVPKAEAPKAEPIAAPKEAILTAMQQVGSGKRIYLSDLRKQFPGVGRDEFDEILKNLEREGRIVLYPLDNPREITPEIREGAITTGFGERHIAYVADETPKRGTPEPVKAPESTVSETDVKKAWDKTLKTAKDIQALIKKQIDESEELKKSLQKKPEAERVTPEFRPDDPDEVKLANLKQVAENMGIPVISSSSPTGYLEMGFSYSLRIPEKVKKLPLQLSNATKNLMKKYGLEIDKSFLSSSPGTVSSFIVSIDHPFILGHEIGHSIDNKLGITRNFTDEILLETGINKNVLTKVVDYTDSTYVEPLFKKYYQETPPRQGIMSHEGIADLIGLWFVDRPKAYELAPGFFKKYEGQIQQALTQNNNYFRKAKGMILLPLPLLLQLVEDEQNG
jgi:uncharacterized protein (UPF0335 family)